MDIAIESQQQLPPLAQHLRRVHTITDRFSMANSYLICDERIVIIDPGSALHARLIVHYLQGFLGRSPEDIDLIVLTRLHPDHTNGVEPLREVCHASVAASVAALRAIQEQTHEGRGLSGISQMAGQVISGTFHHFELSPSEYRHQAQLVDVWLEDVAGLPNHPDWRVIASPLRSVDTLCLYNPFTCELLCGDTVISSEGSAQLICGRTSRPQVEEMLQTLRSLEVHYMYPGHGRPILSKQAITNLQVRY